MEATVVIVAFAAVVIAAVALTMTRRSAGPGDPAAMRELQARTVAVLERIEAIGGRVGAIEHQQSGLRDGLQRLDTGIVQATTLASGIRESSELIRADIARARQDLTGLQASTAARHTREEEAARSLRRLEQVIAGTASKGGAGENIVDLLFSRLPVEWQARQFVVGNQVVEFGLRLPNNLVVPIDSKWPATNLLEAFLVAPDPAEQQRLKKAIETVILQKAREVATYLDADLTAGFALAVVPDAVDELAGAVKADCLRLNVVLLGQSMLVPYLLLVFQTSLRTSRDLDMERLAAHLAAIERSVEQIQEEVEGRLSRSIVMTGNARDALRTHAAGLRAGLLAVRLAAPEVREEADEPRRDLLP